MTPAEYAAAVASPVQRSTQVSTMTDYLPDRTVHRYWRPRLALQVRVTLGLWVAGEPLEVLEVATLDETGVWIERPVPAGLSPQDIARRVIYSQM